MSCRAKKSCQLEDEMKAKEATVLIKMLGNWKQYESGKEYDVNEIEARELLGLGFAIRVEAPVMQAKE